MDENLHPLVDMLKETKAYIGFKNDYIVYNKDEGLFVWFRMEGANTIRMGESPSLQQLYDRFKSKFS